MRPTYTRFPRTILWLVPGREDAAKPGREDAAKPGREDAAKPRHPDHPGSVDPQNVEPFYLSKWPITNEQIEAFDHHFQRSDFSPGDRDTALGVDFELAQAYCRWYAEVSRKPMRLPTEVEWEHACRGGALCRFFWGDDPSQADRYVTDADNFAGRLAEADQKKANDFGLYAMLGHAWEWTAQAVLRGGSFRTPRRELGCELRSERAGVPLDETGFRVAKSLR